MNSFELPDPPQPILYSNAVIGPLKAASNKFKLEFDVLPADMKLPHMRRLGLTSIQKFLSAYHDALLATGIDYPLTGRDTGLSDFRGSDPR